MPLEIHVPKPETKARVLASLEAQRPWNRPAGGWLDDFVALRKAIMLCPFCAPKFNPRARNYEVWRRELLVMARCDGCNQVSHQIRTFIHESTHDSVGEIQKPRRRGRWARY